MSPFIYTRATVASTFASLIAAFVLAEGAAVAESHFNRQQSNVSSRQPSDTFKLVGTYSGIGSMLASVVAPGPTLGSQRLYASYTYSGNTFDVLSIDPDTGNTIVFHNPIPGEYGAWGLISGPDGNVYLGTFPHAHLLKLDPKEETLVDLGRPSSTEAYIWSLAFGSDRRLYGGTYPNCKLVRYDPATEHLDDLGRLDPIQEYARFIAPSKDGFIYAAIGTNANFAAYQISTGALQEILPPPAQSVAFPKVYLGTDGNVYGTVNGRKFSLNQWTATELNSGAIAPAATTDELSDGRTVSLTESLSVSGAETLTIEVTDPTTRETVGHQVPYAGAEMSLFRIGLGPDGALYGSTAMPANFFRAVPNQNSLEQLGIVGDGEVYSFLSRGDSLLMAAYAGLATLMQYQPEVPFVQTTGSGNPVTVRFSRDNDSWRPEAMINGPDGNVYVGAIAGYGLLESPLIAWNVEKSSVQLYDVVPNQSVVSLTSWQNLIIGGTSSLGGPGSQPTQGDAELFIWNPATQHMDFQIVPVVGAKSITDLVTAANGLVYGIANDTLFEFDPETLRITGRQTLPFSTAIYNSATVDETGRIWGLAESGIFSVDTKSLNATMLASSPLQISGGFAFGHGNIFFISGASVYSYAVPLAPVTVQVLPAQTTLSPASTLSAIATVTGDGVTPVGTVTLSNNGQILSSGTLSAGSYTFKIPTSSLISGTNDLLVRFSGDTNYAPNTGEATVTYAGPAFTLAATATETITAGSTATSTVTVTGLNDYVGSVALTCSLTSAPFHATALPTCSPTVLTLVLNPGTPPGSTTISVNTTARAAAPMRSGFDNGRGWLGANDGAVLAILAFLVIPSRRRNWKSITVILPLMIFLSGMMGCGSNFALNAISGSSGNLGTSPGIYTFTVLGTGAPFVNPAPTTTFIVTVK